MSGTEGIVDKEINVLGKLLGELKVVLLLFLVESNVLEKEKLSILPSSNRNFST